MGVEIKERIRQWLIDLIREAVRREIQEARLQEARLSFCEAVSIDSAPAAISADVIFSNKPIAASPIRVPISFEQMQEEAIKAQEEEHAEKAR